MKRYKEQDAKKVAEYLEPIQDLAFSGFFCDDFSPNAEALTPRIRRIYASER
jgi:hypothetical protein